MWASAIAAGVDPILIPGAALRCRLATPRQELTLQRANRSDPSPQTMGSRLASVQWSFVLQKVDQDPLCCSLSKRALQARCLQMQHNPMLAIVGQPEALVACEAVGWSSLKCSLGCEVLRCSGGSMPNLLVQH